MIPLSFRGNEAREVPRDINDDYKLPPKALLLPLHSPHILVEAEPRKLHVLPRDSNGRVSRTRQTAFGN